MFLQNAFSNMIYVWNELISTHSHNRYSHIMWAFQLMNSSSTVTQHSFVILICTSTAHYSGCCFSERKFAVYLNKSASSGIPPLRYPFSHDTFLMEHSFSLCYRKEQIEWTEMWLTYKNMFYFIVARCSDGFRWVDVIILWQSAVSYIPIAFTLPSARE